MSELGFSSGFWARQKAIGNICNRHRIAQTVELPLDWLIYPGFTQVPKFCRNLLRPSLEYWDIRVCTCPKFGAANVFLPVAPS